MLTREDLRTLKLACARELLAQGVVLPQQALDLAKYAESKPEKYPNLKKWIGGQVGGAGFLGLNALGAKVMARENHLGGNEARAKQLFDKLIEKSPVPVETMVGLDNAMYVSGGITAKLVGAQLGKDVKKGVYLGEKFLNPQVLSHEIGHADIDSKLIGKVLQSLPLRVLGTQAPAIGAVTGFMSGLSSDKGSKTRKWGIAAPALAAVPMLLSEVGASTLGLMRLRSAGASNKELLQAAKTLGPAFATYLGLAGIGTMGAVSMQAIGGALRDDDAEHRAKKKVAEVSPEHARRSLDRLDALEQNKPTAGQAARYGTIGGIGGAGIGAIGHMIEHGSPLKGDTPKAKLLNLGANAVKGALGGGAIPLVRNAMDRRAEVGTLRKFMQENPGASNA